MKEIPDRKEQILHEAARLFRKKGYNATTVRMIASALGIEAASLYNHISSKQEILKTLLLPMAQRFAKGMDDIESRPVDAFEKLEELVALHVQLSLNHPDSISLITGEWVHLEEPALSEYSQMRRNYENRFKTIIQEGMNKGLLEKRNLDVALFSILSSLHWLYSWIGRHKELEPGEIEVEMKNCLLLGLKKK